MKTTIVKQLNDRINRLLEEQWDPLEIYGVSKARDEYNAYATRIAGMLIRGTTEEEIFAFLCDVLHEEMEVEMDPDRTRAMARVLIGLKLEGNLADR